MHPESYFQVIDSARLVLSVFLFSSISRKHKLELISWDLKKMSTAYDIQPKVILASPLPPYSFGGGVSETCLSI